MAKSKSTDKSIKKLRRSWVDEHPEVRAAIVAIEEAQKQAHQPKWVADAAAYCASARDAAGRVKDAKARLKDVVERVKAAFDRAVAGDGQRS